MKKPRHCSFHTWGLWVNVDPSIKPGKWVNVDHNPEKVGEIIGRLQCILCILLQYYSSMP